MNGSDTLDREALETFVRENDELERLEDALATFNLFEVLGITEMETRHSAFLAWLLDPKGSHGLGDYFLRAFLARCASLAHTNEIHTFTPIDVDRWTLADTVVERERHHIDILLVNRADGFVCAIENKVKSGEHSNQLTRYRNSVAQYYGDLRPMHVFLTVEGRPPEKGADDSHYVPLSYSVVAKLIERAIDSRGGSVSSSVLSALHQYLETLRRHVLVDSKVQELARSIYYSHRRAIDLIIEARPDTQSEIRDIVRSVMDPYKGELSEDYSVKSFIRYFSPRWDAIERLRKGEGWTESRRMLLFEFRNQGTLGLYVVLGPGLSTTREEVFQYAKEHAPFAPSSLTPKWSGLYRKPILSARDVKEFDPQQVREKIAKEVAEFCKGDLPQIVQGVEDLFRSSTGDATSA